MITLSHPTGNANVCAVLRALDGGGCLKDFHTTLGVGEDTIGTSLARFLAKRRYPIPSAKLRGRPLRELVRLLAPRLGLRSLVRHERGWASTDAIYRDLDRTVAARLRQSRDRPQTVYCYEDGALATFRAARELGIRRVYDLPIAYFATARRLLEEEAERWPVWEPTLGGTRDSAEKMSRKAEELELAEAVVCPSHFVLKSLPPDARLGKLCAVAEFGSPPVVGTPAKVVENRPLRVLFAGSMTQRKGLADVFAAMKLLGRDDVELVVLGSLQAEMAFYRSEYAGFRHEPPRAHAAVLALMRSCDVFVLPSIVEGRALVQQEALSCGLPIIVTANAGAEDLVEEGMTGFLVPIRQPAAIAEKISWFADHRRLLPDMAEAARQKAMATSWAAYENKVLAVVRELLATA